MNESEDLSTDSDASPSLRNRSNNSSGKSSGTSPKGKTPSPKKFEPQYAKAIVKLYNPATRDQILLAEGDVIVDIKKLYSPDSNLWEGKNRRTGKTGIFHGNNVQFYSGTPPISPQIDNPVTSSQSKNNTNHGSKQLITILIVVIAIAVIYVVSDARGQFLWKRLRKPVNLTDLKVVFKAQDPVMWDSLRSGLLPSKSEAVKTFLFVHAKNSPTTECLIKKLSDNYCTVYRARELNFDEEFVSNMKHDLRNRKCMVIYDLENLQADGIAILKGFCDAYTPIVPDAEFYFALDTGEPHDYDSVNKIARQKLESMWSQKYSYDEFGGTVTRLTQNVLPVIGENELPC